jgi:hypothetical protein
VIASSKDLHDHLDHDAWKLFVFRKSRDVQSTGSLLRELCTEIERLTGSADSLVDVLVRAGEIETGLADAASPAGPLMAAVVDRIARALYEENFDRPLLLQSLREVAGENGLPVHIQCSHPEGFSYYGLHPMDFGDLALRLHRDLGPNVAVVGVRSVGSPLGAIVAASLRSCGKSVDRITVRPHGEPYQRTASFDGMQSQWISSKLQQQADFVIVDEGPGFSGSTFLSVAKALVGAGVPHARIFLMGSRPFSQRGGMDDGESWSGFRTYTIDYSRHSPAGAGRNLSEGAWRELLYTSSRQWPACWVEQERIKHLSKDGRFFFKFEGFGRYGDRSRQQQVALAEARFCLPPLGFDNGFGRYEFICGRPLTHKDLGPAILSQMAAYCTFRVKHFTAPNPNPPQLLEMMRINLNVEFGLDEQPFELPLERPVYADCRLLPHEWLLTSDGCILKTDAVGHSEGHQLPGPADIAWDLAGVILEWKLSTTEAEFFLERYRRLSGDNGARRARQYLLPYSILRMAQCRMGAASMKDRDQAKHLYSSYKYYMRRVKEYLGALNRSKLGSPPYMRLSGVFPSLV